MKVLLADEDAIFCDATSSALKLEGFEVIRAGDGAEALRRWKDDRPDVVLVDVAISRPNGFEICRRIRRRNDALVVVLTGSADESAVLQGFASGADDYVPKPCSLRELSWRIRAVSNRKSRRPRLSPREPLAIGDLVLDPESQQIRRGERAIQLTPTEFRIVSVLARQSGHVVRFGRLIELVWGFDSATLGSLRHHVSNIRQKLVALGPDQLDVAVVHGAGYLLSRQQTQSLRKTRETGA